MHALKILSQDDQHAVVGGYGVVFGGVDLEGETFTAGTDFMLDLVPVKPVFIDHAGDSSVVVDGKAVKLAGIVSPVGRVVEVTADDVGLYMKLQLEKAGQYWQVVEQMLGSGKAGLSSGTVGHLARREGKTITRWPIVEESITLTPAEPRTVGVERLKYVADLNPGLEVVVTEADGTSAVGDAMATGEETAEAAGRPAAVVISEMESEQMSGDNVAAADPRDEQIKALSDRLNQMMQVLENSPALKRAGYATDDGGAADPTHKSFGDFLLAVKRGDTKRLSTVYGATKDMYEAAGAAGGYLVPQEHVTRLLEVAAQQSPIYDRVTKIPVTSDAGDFPVLNQFTAPTAGLGGTYAAAGIVPGAVAELETLPEVQPTFTNLEWRVHKLGGIVEVSNELIADSAVSIEALLRRLFSVAIAAKNERNILRGSGAGEPLGILNSPVAVGITTAADNTFAYADALAMWARFKAFGGGSPVWIMHPSVLPDLGVMTVASGSPVVWAGNLASGQPNTLLGYPIILSEHMPQANGDDVLPSIASTRKRVLKRK